jgi:2Fe-2S ferredoxin
MPQLIFVDREGFEHVVEGRKGYSVMEVIRQESDDILAICGGCCSCGTCHVHVDEAWLSRLKPMRSDEDDVLDCSDERLATSRLACQIDFGPELDGLRVTIAPED